MMIISIEGMRDLSRVSVVRCKDYQMEELSAALQKTFENLGGIAKFVRPGVHVVLKPNLLMEKSPEEAATTHPAFLQAIILMIQEAGGRVTIAESPGGPYTESLLKRVHSACGIDKVAEATGATLTYDLSIVEVDNPNGKYLKKLSVIKPLADADLIINMPKLKTHGSMGYTGAVKNMFGAVPGLQKAEFHMRMPKYEDFADALIDIYLSVKPTLNIMDAVVGMDGEGPSAGSPKPIGLIMAGENGFALDYAALHVVGIEPMDIPIIKQAALRGLCPKAIDEVDLVGEALEQVKIADFSAPQVKNLRTVSFFEKGPLKSAIDLMRPKPAFDKSKCIGCGDCAKSCPVHIIKMKDKRPEPDLTTCIRCFCCQELCPAKAVTIKRNKAGEFLMNKGVPVFIDLMNKVRKPSK